MYIENIKLFNFRNFKHNLIVENFCPGINIFVGPNGSGKSSFFEAIKLLTSKKLFDLKHELSNEQNFSEQKRLKNYLKNKAWIFSWPLSYLKTAMEICGLVPMQERSISFRLKTKRSAPSMRTMGLQEWQLKLQKTDREKYGQ